MKGITFTLTRRRRTPTEIPVQISADRVPYDRLVEEKQTRSRRDPEFELLDTGAFAKPLLAIFIEYAKAVPKTFDPYWDRQSGPDPAPLHVLPTPVVQEHWSWGLDGPPPAAAPGTEQVRRQYHRLKHYYYDQRWLYARAPPRFSSRIMRRIRSEFHAKQWAENARLRLF